jgi:hypothetical protein
MFLNTKLAVAVHGLLRVSLQAVFKALLIFTPHLDGVRFGDEGLAEGIPTHLSTIPPNEHADLVDRIFPVLGVDGI